MQNGKVIFLQGLTTRTPCKNVGTFVLLSEAKDLVLAKSFPGGDPSLRSGGQGRSILNCRAITGLVAARGELNA